MKNLRIHLLIILILAILGACTTQNIASEEPQSLPVEAVPLNEDSRIIVDISQPILHMSNCGNKNANLTSSKSVDIEKLVDTSSPLAEVNQSFRQYIDSKEGDITYCIPRQKLGVKFLQLYNKSKEAVPSTVPCYYLDMLLDAGTLEPSIMYTTLKKVRRKIDKKSYRNYQDRILENAKMSLNSIEKDLIDFETEELKETEEEYKHSIREVIRILDK